MVFLSPFYQFQKIQRKHQFGFTLIELVIVIALLGIISSVISLNYSQITRRQNVKQEGLTLKQNLRLVQSKAKSGDRGECPASAMLYGWRVQFIPSSGDQPASIRYQPVCPESTFEEPVVEVDFKPGLSFNPINPGEIYFRPLNLPVVNAPISIAITNGEYECIVSVEITGEISDEGCS